MEYVERNTSIGDWIESVNLIREFAHSMITVIDDQDRLENVEKGSTIIDSLNVTHTEIKPNTTAITSNPVYDSNTVKDLNDVRTKILNITGELKDLKTDNKKNLVLAINIIKSLVGDNELYDDSIIEMINELSDSVGSHFDLTCDNEYKQSMVRSINNLIMKIGSRNLNLLATKNKSDLIISLNELHDRIVYSQNNAEYNTKVIGIIEKYEHIVEFLERIRKNIGNENALYAYMDEKEFNDVRTSMNDILGDIGDIKQIETNNNISFVNALREVNNWKNHGPYISSSNRVMVGSSVHQRQMCHVTGNIKSYRFKASNGVTGNVTGNVIGNVFGNTSGTTLSWDKDIRLKIKGKLGADIYFGGRNNVPASATIHTLKNYRVWVNSNYFKPVKELYRTSYNDLNGEDIDDSRYVEYPSYVNNSYWDYREKFEESTVNISGNNINLNINDKDINGLSHINHLHDDEYVTISDWSSTWHVSLSCSQNSSESTAWSNVTSMVDLSSSRRGSLVAVTGCGRKYLWSKFNDGNSKRSWARIV